MTNTDKNITTVKTTVSRPSVCKRLCFWGAKMFLKCLCKTIVSEKAKGVNRFSLRFILKGID